MPRSAKRSVLLLIMLAVMLTDWGWAPWVTARQSSGATAAAERAMIESHVRTLRQIVAGADDRPRPQVLLFGTFHFSNPGLDAHKSKYTYDLFSLKGQKELQEVLDRLAEFKPTKILIERAGDDQKGTDAWFGATRRAISTRTPTSH